MKTSNKKLKINGVKAGSYLYLICRAAKQLKNAGGEIIAGNGDSFGIEIQNPTVYEAQQYAAWAIHQGFCPGKITAKKPDIIGMFLPPYIPAERNPRDFLRLCDYRRYHAIFKNTNGEKGKNETT